MATTTTTGLRGFTRRFRDFFYWVLYARGIREDLTLAIEHRNAEQCLTHNLPTELLLRIAESLKGPDLLSFVSACRWFRSLQKIEPRMSMFPRPDRKTFMERLRVDDYLVLAAEEVRSSKETALLCRSCLTSHPIAAFTHEERSRPAVWRSCFGSSARFVLCEHESFNNSELRTKLSLNSKKTMCCPKCQINIGEGTCHVFQGQTCISRKPVTFVKTVVRLKNFPADEWISWSQLLDRLGPIDLYICPHMRTSSPAVWERLPQVHKEMKQFDDRFHSVRVGGVIFSSPNSTSSASARCKNTDCMTWVEVERFAGCPWIRFEILRYLGDLKAPTDRTWCAQLEKGLDREGLEVSGSYIGLLGCN